jgi:hypothetical protein
MKWKNVIIGTALSLLASCGANQLDGIRFVQKSKVLASLIMAPILSEEFEYSNCHIRPVALGRSIRLTDGRILIHVKVWSCAKDLYNGYLDVAGLTRTPEPAVNTIASKIETEQLKNVQPFVSPGWGQMYPESGTILKVDGKKILIFPERPASSEPYIEKVRLHRIDLQDQ